MEFEVLMFDLDNTIYPRESGLWSAIGDRMNRYMVEKVGLPEKSVPDLRRRYYTTYGTPLRGPQRHHGVSADEYLNYVHDLPLKEYLQPDQELRSLLLSLPQECWIFTNADADHATRVLKTMRLDDCFVDIVDIRKIEFACKPEKRAYEKALKLTGNPDPEKCVFFDDAEINLLAANEFGFTTVLVNNSTYAISGVKYTISSLKDLPQTIPELWQ